MSQQLGFEHSPRYTTERTRPILPIVTSTGTLANPSVTRQQAGEHFGTRIGHVYTQGSTVERQLFEATAAAKVWTAQVAMHLETAVRERLFRQLDVLHDSDEWIGGDRPINIDSYKSLVRAILYHEINSRPSLALMPSGHVLAHWSDDADKLTIEFLPDNKTRWLVVNSLPAGLERATGTSPLERLRDVIQPYGGGRWFDGC